MNTLTTYIKQVMRNPSTLSPIMLFQAVVFIGGILAALFGAQSDIEETTHTQTPQVTQTTTTATSTPRLSTVAQPTHTASASSHAVSESTLEIAVETPTDSPAAHDDEIEHNIVITDIATVDEPSQPLDGSHNDTYEAVVHTLEAVPDTSDTPDTPDVADVEPNDVTPTTTHPHVAIDITSTPGEVRIDGDEVSLTTLSPAAETTPTETTRTEETHAEETRTEETHTEEIQTEETHIAEAEVVINEPDIGETSALAPTSTTLATLPAQAPAPSTTAITTSTIAAEEVTPAPTHVTSPAAPETTTTSVTPAKSPQINPDNPDTDDDPQYPSPWSTDSIYAKNAPYVTMHQGDKIQTLTSSCTLSYVDKETRTGYTAAHCIGDRLTTDVAQRRTAIPLWGVHEGTPTYIGEAIMATNVTDLAIVKFADNVVIGDNIYSGNTMFTGELSADDYICRYGAESRIGACTPYYSTNDDTVYSQDEHLIPGDSGGPSWVSDAQGNPKGYLGVYAGSIYMSGGHFTAPTAFDRTILLNAGIFNP